MEKYLASILKLEVAMLNEH